MQLLAATPRCSDAGLPGHAVGSHMFLPALKNSPMRFVLAAGFSRGVQKHASLVSCVNMCMKLSIIRIIMRPSPIGGRITRYRSSVRLSRAHR